MRKAVGMTLTGLGILTLLTDIKKRKADSPWIGGEWYTICETYHEDEVNVNIKRLEEQNIKHRTDIEIRENGQHFYKVKRKLA